MLRLLCCAAALTVVVSALAPSTAAAWGDRSHPMITRLAIETLPPQLAGKFEAQSAALARYSLEPDTLLRSRFGRAETIRHFIDLDAYMKPPFTDFPRTLESAKSRVGARKAQRYGTVPWRILELLGELRQAFSRDEAEWVRIAGYLAHYVADTYQPLHLTVNFDGQLSGAKGLHKRFENGLVDAAVDRYATEARPLLTRARIVDDPREAIFQALFRSYATLPALFRADRVAAQRQRRGSDAYYNVLRAEVDDLCRRQIADAAVMLGSLWLTAWHESGARSPTHLGPVLDRRQERR